MTAHEKWAEEMRVGLCQMQTESAGILSIYVVRPLDVASLYAAARAGEGSARKVVSAVEQTLRMIFEAPVSEPMLCACCPRPVHGRNFAVCVAIGDEQSAKAALVIAVCNTCGPNVPAISEKALSAFRVFWPDMRRFDVTHPEGGRA